MVVARTILLISLVVQEGKQWIELWGGGGSVLVVVVVVVVAGRQKGPSNPTTGTATRTDIIRLKITKTNQSNRLNYLSQYLTLF